MPTYLGRSATSAAQATPTDGKTVSAKATNDAATIIRTPNELLKRLDALMPGEAPECFAHVVCALRSTNKDATTVLSEMRCKDVLTVEEDDSTLRIKLLTVPNYKLALGGDVPEMPNFTAWKTATKSRLVTYATNYHFSVGELYQLALKIRRSKTVSERVGRFDVIVAAFTETAYTDEEAYCGGLCDDAVVESHECLGSSASFCFRLANFILQLLSGFFFYYVCKSKFSGPETLAWKLNKINDVKTFFRAIVGFVSTVLSVTLLVLSATTTKDDPIALKNYGIAFGAAITLLQAVMVFAFEIIFALCADSPEMEKDLRAQIGELGLEKALNNKLSKVLEALDKVSGRDAAEVKANATTAVLAAWNST